MGYGNSKRDHVSPITRRSPNTEIYCGPGVNNAGNNSNEGESGWYTFPVNFNSTCFALFCGLRNTDTNKPMNYDSEVQPRNWTTTKFNVYKQKFGSGDPWFANFIWWAIGR
ncbi:gp53-like domain-containing protein [Phascolarctobacterium faecium]|uniref:gp53-like domain-containing protein n=1 Tax=Phascolarctobacterium faecium TaxID=33025 RepID=UPI003F986F82